MSEMTVVERNYGEPLPDGRQVDYERKFAADELQKWILQHVINECPIHHLRWGGQVVIHVRYNDDEAEVSATVKIWKQSQE